MNQIVQRIGRTIRKTAGKDTALIYTIYLSYTRDLSGNGGDWKTAHVLEDKGEWKVEDPNRVKQHCGITGQPPITFAGPICVFRSDCMADYDIRWASVRSIDTLKETRSAHNCSPVNCKRMAL